MFCLAGIKENSCRHRRDIFLSSRSLLAQSQFVVLDNTVTTTARVIRLFLIYLSLLAASSSHALEHSSRNWQLTAPEQKAMTLSIASRLDQPRILTLSVDGHTLFEKPMRHAELLGACQEKRTHAPRFIVSELMEGVGLEQAYMLRKNNGWQLLAIPSVEGISRVDEIAGCYRAASNWSLDGDAIDCECDVDKLSKPQLFTDQWADLLSDYQTGLYLNESTSEIKPRLIKNTAHIETLLERARANKSIRFEKAVKGRRWLIIEHKSSIYGSFSLGLIKQENYWSVWYYVRGNSKSFNTISDIENVKENLLSATMCTKECDWWGKSESVDIGLDTLILKVNERE
jgi:hypothetical protein